jgi:hypothetical protein
VYLCTDDAYCPTPDLFPTLDAFLAYCMECFGESPLLHECVDGRVVDAHGRTVLVHADTAAQR